MTPTGTQVPEWTLADRLRKIRRDRHMTQDQMAHALGVKPVTWSSWEAGRTRPTDPIGLATRIETLYGIPAAWTLGVLNEAPQRRRDERPRHGGRRWYDLPWTARA